MRLGHIGALPAAKTRSYWIGGKAWVVDLKTPPGCIATKFNPTACTPTTYPINDIYQGLMALAAPPVYRDFAGAPTYGALPDVDIVVAGKDAWQVPTPQPHYVYLASGERVLSMGKPTSARDPYEFLRAAIVSRDWSAVGYWYAFWINSAIKDTGYALNPFHGISQINLVDYNYTTTLGGLGFDDYDIGGFIREVWRKFLPWQKQNNENYVGGLGYPGNTPAEIQGYSPHADMKSFAFSWLQYPDVGGKDKSTLRIGWVPDSSTIFGDYMQAIVITIVITIVTWGVGTVLGAAGGGLAGGTAGATEGAAVGTAVGTAAGATTGAIVGGASTAILDEIVVTAAVGSGISAAGAASVAAGLAAGAIISSSAAPALTAPAVGTGNTLDEIVVTAAAPSSAGSIAGSVAAGLSAGAVATTTTAPAISSSTTTTPETPPQTSPDSGTTLDEVTVTAAQQPVEAVSVGDALAAGAIIEAAAPPITTTQPTVNSDSSFKTKLESLIKQYGAKYVKDNLLKLLTNQLGRQPTPQELADAQSQVDEQAAMPWILGATLVGALILIVNRKR